MSTVVLRRRAMGQHNGEQHCGEAQHTQQRARENAGPCRMPK
ncbi:hypothetical protein [Streptomyces brasiliscabiei]